MTRPVQPEDSQLFWETESAKRNAARQNAANADTSVVASIQDQENAETSNILGQTRNVIQQTNEDATQGHIFRNEVAQQKRREAEELEWRKKQQDSTRSLQDSVLEWQANLEADYAKQLKKAQKDWEKQLKQKGPYVNNLSQLVSKNGKVVNTVLTGDQYEGKAHQIAQYALQAGFPPSVIPTVVAIAYAESRGNSTAINTGNSNGSTDYGLMQINTIHGQLLKKYDWADPAQNMAMAYQIYKDAGGSFTPWSAYNNGSYQEFMAKGSTATKKAEDIRKKGVVTSTATGQLRKTIVNNAKTYLGIDYVWGGNGPKYGQGFDCSGLVQQVFGDLGIALPRISDQQATMGVRVPISQLEPGDLVGWAAGGHIAIYAGNGKIIEAQQNGVPVHVRSLKATDKVFGVKLDLTTMGKKAILSAPGYKPTGSTAPKTPAKTVQQTQSKTKKATTVAQRPATKGIMKAV